MALPPIIDARRLAGALARDPSIRLLDVRTPGEFDAEHIPGSVNVPLDQLAAHAATIAGIAAPIAVICRSGARARSADAVLRQAGARRVHVLEGGVIAWLAHGYSVERRSGGGLLRGLLGAFLGGSDPAQVTAAVERLVSGPSASAAVRS